MVYMTHNCDDSTIKHALYMGLAVEFLADAAGAVSYVNRAGTATAEEIHRTFIVVLQLRFAAVMTADEWIEILRTRKPAARDRYDFCIEPESEAAESSRCWVAVCPSSYHDQKRVR